jgi:formylglycine-generating enzyme required for sulfatase activity
MTKRHAKLGAAVCAAHLLAASGASANNIRVSNVSLTKNAGSSTATVQFDLAWDNSWRVTAGPANWDAAWVFVKYHTGDLIWKTATLDLLDAAHSVPAAATLDVGNNANPSSPAVPATRGLGAFIYRSAPGSGNVSYPGIKLKWNYIDDLVADSALVTLDVHAIEMVYVPQGSFQVGDGVSRTGTADVATLVAGATPAGTLPFTISTAGPLQTGLAAGRLSHAGQTAGTYKDIPVAFSTGFNAYYLMKYEGSQAQWAAFLNTTSKLPAIAYTYFETLQPITPAVVPPRDQMNGRQVFFSADLPAPSVIPGPVPPNIAPTIPTRPIVQAKFPDRAFISSEIATLAYLDWSGLRPMSEFEYEKAARGPIAPVAGEFAWGTADVALLSYGNPGAGHGHLAEDGLPGEAPAANYNYFGGNAWTRATILQLPAGGPILGPARVGMFARQDYSVVLPWDAAVLPPPTPPLAPARIQSGAGYYGVMDLTGNVSEMVAKWGFALATSTTATFVAEHGDGVLAATGLHNVPGWALTPAGATFYGLRGGSFNEQAVPLSQRSLLTGGAAGSATTPGIRGARTAPVAQ